MSDSDIKITDLAPTDLLELFPEAKLTMRDRLPTSMLLLYTILNINKAIKDIKYSTEELREAILGLVAMVPDTLRDEQFTEDLDRATQPIIIDVRPAFCGVKASFQYCERKSIPAYLKVPQLNYFDMY